MIASHEQKLPVDLEMFWGSGENKMIFQNYFCGWLAEYNDSIDFELIYVCAVVLGIFSVNRL